MSASTKKSILVLVGGGSCPAINTYLYWLARGCADEGVSVRFVRDGYSGLVNMSLKHVELGDLAQSSHFSGSLIGTSRFPLTKQDDGSLDLALKSIREARIDAIVAIGGDDTLNEAAILSRDYQLPIIGVPKTLDGDVAGTSFTLGFSTVVQKTCECISSCMSSWRDHHYIGIFETLGRHAGHLALWAGAAAGSHAILLPEFSVDADALFETVQAAVSHERFACVVIAEGANIPFLQFCADHACDPFHHPLLRDRQCGRALAQFISERTNIPVRVTQSGDSVREAPAVVADLFLAQTFARATVRAINENIHGVMICSSTDIHSASTIPLENISIRRVSRTDVERLTGRFPSYFKEER